MKEKFASPSDELTSQAPASELKPRCRILVVEDDADIRRLNADVLTRHGYDVETAEDGALAWEALNGQSYDLMVTDNTMPNTTGVELLRKLHAADLALPTIMATSVLPKGEFEKHPWLEPAATLIKPYTVAELLGKVKAVLRASQSDDERIAPPGYGESQPLPNHLPL